MAFEWGTLSDFASVQGGFAYKSKDFQESGSNKVLKIKNVRFGFVDYGDTAFISDELASETLAWSTDEGDILISMTGSGPNAPQSLVGRVARVWQDEEKAWINQRVGRIVINEEGTIHPDFIYYLLSQKSSQDFLVSNSSGSANQANISGKTIGMLPCPKVSFEESSLIASTLLSLDKKIILNRQINQTLEQMAQTLFKSWFVDFDPVIDNALDAGFFDQGKAIPDELQARAEQRQALRHAVNEANKANQPHSTRTNPMAGDALASPYQPLPDDLRQLFPNEFEESELGWVPKGWGCVNLTMLVDTISKTYPLKTVEEVIFLNTGDIEDGRFLHSDYSKVSGLPGQAKKSIQRNDILFSEIRPKNKRFAFVNFDSEHHVVSTKLMVLRAKEAVNPLFAYFLLTLEKTTNELQRIAELRSGTFPQITYNELGLISFALPDNSDLIEKFVVSYLQPFYDKSFKALAENEALANLRDTLLPKLISGELRLDEVEFTIAETITATTA